MLAAVSSYWQTVCLLIVLLFGVGCRWTFEIGRADGKGDRVMVELSRPNS